MQETADNVKAQVLTHLINGLSSRAIAGLTGLSKTTINKIRLNAGIELQKSAGGAPRKLSGRDDRAVVHLLKDGTAKSARQASRISSQILGKTVSAQTIRRSLHRSGLRARKKIKKPLLTQRHKMARLNWALIHREWTVEDWKKIIWSDETKINRIVSDGIQWTWRKDGEGLSEQNVQGTVKFSGGNIMVWGCMTWAGPGGLDLVKGRMNAEQYCEILDRGLQTTFDALSILPEMPDRENLVFQQDNDPKHTSKRAKQYFSDKGISVMKWPAQSPDLNPIEHLWSILKLQLSKLSVPASGVHEQWDRVRSEWLKIKPEQCQRLIESMPRRCAAVIKAKGGNTKY